ncbi:PilZ domain-containing protein [Mesorhizobium sp. BR1-1-16]|uniref:PilZ domain-containing protein n=1 Tax=Mesorhizobium sp. BR1-1-16 TaxID=2876653 RepID=UPI001CCDD400|nr:PilZ domain-containing protein [Mesorhizobium sp. BR1-1-16]MBZ9937508.1 PilZ domain-containing protein [Mesorhizobium sp. BR1-1-16]
MLELATTHRPTLNAYDRRRYRRYEVALLGRYMLESRREYPCQTIDISTDTLSLAAPIQGRIGERIIAYIDQLGRVEGTITRHAANGFVLSVVATLRKRDKLATTLEWLAERSLAQGIDERTGVRIVPRNPFSQLALPDGSLERCRVIDLSTTGAALALSARPALGTSVALGRIGARVIRHTEDGVAIAFASVQDETELRAQF